MLFVYLVTTGWILASAYYVRIQSINQYMYKAGRPGSSEVPRNP